MIDSNSQSVEENEDRLFGVTALDSPQVQMTKAEIRALMTEITKLSRAKLSVQDFVQGFMPRLQSAMGASACLIWSVDFESLVAVEPTSFALAGATATSPLLVEGDRPTEAHRKILQCVCDENQPLLVPPAGVIVRSARPVNPIPESLILVPVRILDEIRYLVEVVQRPGGGPATQKGYLRFVSEMSGLMSDFLVHNQLRQLSRSHQIDEANRELLHALAAANTIVDRERLFVERQRHLAQADHALLFRQEHHALRLRCISNTGEFDARSELVQIAERLAADLDRAHNSTNEDDAAQNRHGLAKRMMRVTASERRQNRDGQSDSTTETTSTSAALRASQSQLIIDDFCSRIGCRTLCWTRIGNSPYRLLVSYREQDPQDEIIQASLARYQDATGILLDQSRTARKRWTLPTSRMARTTLGATLLTAVSLLPIPDRVSVPALLQPVQQQRYYAPMMASVKEVLVSDGQWVAAGTPLVQLHSTELDAQILQHESKLAQAREALAEISAAIGRSGTLAPERLAELELQRGTLEIQAKGEAKLLTLNQLLRDSLLIRSARDGQIHAWGVNEHLVGRVVGPDELLLTTFQPEAPWKFQLDIPERRAGRIEAKLHSDEARLPVQFTFVSLPEKSFSGELREMGPVLKRDPSDHDRGGSSAGAGAARGIVRAEVVVDGNVLAIRKIGAVANASIDCGRVPLGWLLVRDGFVRLANTIRMLW